MEVKDVLMTKSIGAWKPNYHLTNAALMWYESPNYAHRRVFPNCPVELPSGHYFEFDKADLARDNVHVKPPFDTVAPAVFGISEQSYSCKVHQELVGIDKLMVLPYQRERAPFDMERELTKTVVEQIALHQEIDFAKKFFNAQAWTNVWTGSTSNNEVQKKFKKFDDTTDPVDFIDARANEIRREGRRRPNKLALGVEVFTKLKNNAAIKERIKYSGTQQNPAIVTESVLAQIFGVDEVIVLDATYNAASHGAPADMQYVCDSKGALLLYAPETPRIDAPSAGYIFSWRLDNNNYLAIDVHEGKAGTHARFVEGLVAYDMKKTSDALAVYLADCC